MTRGQLIALGVVAAACLFWLSRRSANSTENTQIGSAQIGVSSAGNIINPAPGSLAAIQSNALRYPAVAAFLKSQAALFGMSVAELEQTLSLVPGTVRAHLHSIGRLKGQFAKTQDGGSLGTGAGTSPTSGMGGFSDFDSDAGFGGDFDGFGGEGSV